MHKEEMEGGARIKSVGTQHVCREETKGGTRIESRGTQPTCVKRKHMKEESSRVACREETDGGKKLGGHVQRGNGWGKKA